MKRRYKIALVVTLLVGIFILFSVVPIKSGLGVTANCNIQEDTDPPTCIDCEKNPSPLSERLKDKPTGTIKYHVLALGWFDYNSATKAAHKVSMSCKPLVNVKLYM